MKRLFDIFASGLGLLFLSPLFLILAIWIKLDSKGPVFYRQVRVGRGNKDFRIFKFRSMRVGADKQGLITVGGHDPRITRSGYFIRKYKLDEFPQLKKMETIGNTLAICAGYGVKICIVVQNITQLNEIYTKDGSNKIAVNVFAAAVGADGKIAAASSDCVEVTFTFTAAGVSTLDTAKAIASKKEQGSNYGMVAYGGSAKEWFEQAAAFDAACVGKTTQEIAGLQAEDGHGVSDLQAAGCTIYVTGFVKAATKH